MTILRNEYKIRRAILLLLIPLTTATSVLSLIILRKHPLRQLLSYVIGELLSVIMFIAQILAFNKTSVSSQTSKICSMLVALISGLSLCGGIAWIERMLLMGTPPSILSLAVVPLLLISLPLRGYLIFQGLFAKDRQDEDHEKQNHSHHRSVSFKPSALTLVEQVESNLYASTKESDPPHHTTRSGYSCLRAEKAAIANLSDSLLPPHLQLKSFDNTKQIKALGDRVDIASEKLQMVTSETDQLKDLGDIPQIMPALIESPEAGASVKYFPFTEWKRLSEMCTGELERNGAGGSHYIKSKEPELKRCYSDPSLHSLEDQSFQRKRDITGSTTSSQHIESKIIQYIEHNVESEMTADLSISGKPVIATPASSPAKPRRKTSPIKKFRDLKHDFKKHQAKKSSCNFDCLHDTTTPLCNKKQFKFPFKQVGESCVDNEWKSLTQSASKATPESNTSCPSSLVGEYDREKWNTIRSRLESARHE